MWCAEQGDWAWSVLRPLFNMRACLSSLLLGLFALQRSLGSPSTAGLVLNSHSHNQTRLRVGPVLNSLSHNRTRHSVGSVLNSHSHNRTRLSIGSVLSPHTQNRTKLPDGGKDPHQRPKRGWVWNQFYVLEEHIGPEPQYVGKVRAAMPTKVYRFYYLASKPNMLWRISMYQNDKNRKAVCVTYAKNSEVCLLNSSEQQYGCTKTQTLDLTQGWVSQATEGCYMCRILVWPLNLPII